MGNIMIRSGALLLLLFGSLLLFGGCATVQTDEEWEKIRKMAHGRIRQVVLWEQSAAEKESVQKEVDSLLADGLSRNEAVRIAMINNRTLQSAFENIGISKSDLVQAGLFTNPSLEALFRFPSGGGRTNVEAGAFFSLSDLWQIPFRKSVAAARLEVTIMDVGSIILETAAEAKHAYDAVEYTAKSKKETEKILQRFREIRDEAAVRRDFGFMRDQDVYLAEIVVLEGELELMRFERELAIAKARLTRVLGLGPIRQDYEIVGKNSETPDQIPKVEQAIEYALGNRPDIQMARFKIRLAEKTLQLEKRRIFKHVGVGASYEGDVEGTDAFGPAIDIQVPLFDQNQARISRAEYGVRQAQKDLQALEGQVWEEIASDLERIHLFQTRAENLREKILPLREKILAYAERWVTAMQLNRLFVLEAQRGFLESQREYLNAQLALQGALTDLELHLGGRLP
jgi:cobalt-zinc-cadmium efflux system outer membrane protein